jgi:hypothetical protein
MAITNPGAQKVGQTGARKEEFGSFPKRQR